MQVYGNIAGNSPVLAWDVPAYYAEGEPPTVVRLWFRHERYGDKEYWYSSDAWRYDDGEACMPSEINALATFAQLGEWAARYASKGRRGKPLPSFAPPA